MSSTYGVGAAPPRDTDRVALGKRIDAIGWGMLLVVTGVVLLVPAEVIAQGTWLIAVGVLVLALNVIRYRLGVGVSGLTTLLGAAALATGLGEMLDVRLPLFAIAFIVIGALIVFRSPKMRNR